MKVSIDDVWATPSTLHVRVTTWSETGQRWRKYHSSVPIDDIEPEAIRRLQEYVAAALEPEPAHHEVPLF